MNRYSRYRASVTLNVVLSLTVGMLVICRPQKVIETSSHDEDGKISPTLLHGKTKSKRGTEPASTVGRDRRKWMEQLRSSGMSDEVLATAIIADCDSRWKKRMSDCREQYLRGEMDASELTVIEDERTREKESNLLAALGEEGYRNWDRAKLLGDMHLEKISLSPEENEALYNIRKSMQQRTQELDTGLRDGTIDPLDCDAERAKARNEADQKTKSLLGDERYAVTQGIGDESRELWRKLKGLNVTDTQFQSLQEVHRQLELQRVAYEETVLKNPANAPDYQQFSKSLDQSKEEAYQKVLGSDAYEKFQKQEDSRYSQMKQYARAWGIDDSCIDHVYGAIKTYEKSIQEQQSQYSALEAQGQPVDWDGAGRMQEQIAEQTRQSLENFLGVDRFAKLQRNGILPFTQ